MMYGQLVAAGQGWPARDSRPVIRLRVHTWCGGRPMLEAASRAVVGAALGGAIGALTGGPLFWLGLGVALAVALGAVRDGARGRLRE
ncbi:MAG TPA: hypothetical protein VMB71_12605 [Acetobacteraceae bacterium]|nr:hypothetical protein [Acetobacteraceae bacterium]